MVNAGGIYFAWGPRGVLKTATLLCSARTCSTGRSFGKWDALSPIRVLYIDGELGPHDLQLRLREVGEAPISCEHFQVLTYVDIPAIKTLAAPESIAAILAIIDLLKPDLVIYDNVNSLAGVSIREGHAYDLLLLLFNELAVRGIAQLWEHHSGFNSTHSFGDSRFEMLAFGMLKLARAKPRSNPDERGVEITVDKPFRMCRGDQAGHKSDRVFQPRQDRARRAF